MLVFDEAGFGVGTQRTPWGEVRSVGLRTTADGPFAEDVFWLFVTDGGVVELPGGLVQTEHLGALQALLPGFDNEKVIRAMGSTDERMFRVWHRDAEHTRWSAERHGARFCTLVERLGGDGADAGAAFETLAAAWGGAGRAYHGLEHLAECLRQLDLSGLASDRAELALWFHDAVYVAGAKDNEEQSARLLLAEAARLGLGPKTAEAAAAMVRATAHGAERGPGAPATQAGLEAGCSGQVGAPPDPARPTAAETALVLDVDLSILGAEPVRFLEFEHSIEEEYAKVPGLQFRVGRGRFLAALLARDRLFHTPFFRERCEAAARRNLEALLESPRYQAWRLTRWLPL